MVRARPNRRDHFRDMKTSEREHMSGRLPTFLPSPLGEDRTRLANSSLGNRGIPGRAPDSSPWSGVSITHASTAPPNHRTSLRLDRIVAVDGDPSHDADAGISHSD